MNVEIFAKFRNGYFKPDYKDKKTGEIVEGDYIVQVEQTKVLDNGSIEFENYNIPVERSMAKMFQDKKAGDMVKVPCNVYGENFAQLKIGKAKK